MQEGTGPILTEFSQFLGLLLEWENTSIMPTLAMKTVFMGTPGIAIPVLAAVMELGHHIVGVYAPPDKPARRGRRLAASPVKGYAQEHNLAVFQPQSLRESLALQQIAGLKPELIVVAAYGKILPQEVLSLCPSGCINIHPSLLPRHRGPSPVATAIIQGDAVTGVTLIRMDVGIDTGPILALEGRNLSILRILPLS